MIAKFFDQNPRLLVLALALTVVAGLSAYFMLPRMEDPVLKQRIGVVQTRYPGADAEQVETLVSQPLEERIREVRGLERIRSESIAGMSSIEIELADHVEDVEEAWSLVRDQVEDAGPHLPEEAASPEFQKPEMKACAVILALKWKRSEEPNFVILGRLADSLKQVLRSIPGTESVDEFGGPEEEVVVALKPEVLRRLELTVADLAQQIRESESNRAAGVFRGARTELLLELGEKPDVLEGLRNTPIELGADRRQLLNLADIATISKGTEDPPSSLALVDGLPAVVLGVYVRDERRLDLWSDKLQSALREFESTLPPGIDLGRTFTQNRYVEDRLHQLLRSLLLSMGAVIGVVFVMMGWRSMLLVGAALPLSALIVLSGMRWLEIPIHQMSVTGLIISLGLLIDNAIIIVDEVRGRLWDGAPGQEAIGESLRHLALPLFGSTLTTALAFTPITMLPGPAGEFVRSIAISVILAISASFLLAMTIVPVLTVRLQPRTADGRPFWRYGIKSRSLERAYRWTLVQLYEVPAAGILLGLSLPAFGFLQARNLPQQFFPPVDRDQISIDLELAASSSLAETRQMALAVRESALANDAVEHVHWFVGGSAPKFYYNLLPSRRNAPSYAQAMVELKPAADPQQTVRELQNELGRDYSQSRLVVRQLEQGPPVSAPVEVRLFGPDLAVLQRLGSEVRLLLSEIPNVVHTRADLEETVPKISLRIDEREARLAGLSRREIARQLYTSLEGLEAGTVTEATEEIPVRVRLESSARANLDAIASLPLKPLTPRGRASQGPTLTALGEWELNSHVAGISRINGKRMNSVKAYLTAGVLPVTVTSDLKKRLAVSNFELPPGYHLEFGGEIAERNQAVGGLLANVPLLVALTLTALVCAFQSFRVSFIIAMVGGLAIGLGLAALWTFGYAFGFMAILGIIGLVGIAINDAIVVLAGIRDHPEARAGRVSAISDVVVRRTRHVLTTSLTTMAGFTPLVLGGGEFWPPVAIAIAGGVAGATILALYFAPSLYLILVCQRGLDWMPKLATAR